MTYEEAIEEMENIYQNGFDNDFDNDEIEKPLDAIRIAIEALEKQIPQRVEYVKGANIMFCPGCKSYLTGYKYCGQCGQAVDIDNRIEKK